VQFHEIVDQELKEFLPRVIQIIPSQPRNLLYPFFIYGGSE
jgi:hypothetical protein